jgi:glycosyltransferase involved in cell wall biosynthesis
VRLLVVSHPCVTPTNQDFFGRVRRRTGWEMKIIAPSGWRNEYGAQRLRRSPGYDGELLGLPVLRPGDIPLHAYARGLRSAIRRWRPDAVYAHHEPYGVATWQVAEASTGIPLAFYSAQNLRKTYPPPVAALERWLYRRAALALPVTDAVARVLRDKGFGGRVEVLPLAVDMAPGQDIAARPTRPGPLTLGYVGRLAPEKGIGTLLDALAELSGVDVRCVIAGDGPAREELERHAERVGVADRVRWLGYVPHDAIAAAYARCDAIVVPSLTVPSWTEQFGRVVIEALSYGRPVLTSDSGELPNLVADTAGGWTFREGDHADLARRIRALVADPAQLHGAGERGKAVVGGRYSLDAVAQRFVSALDSLVGA